MPVDYLAELTGQVKSFTLAHAAGTNPLVHSFTLTPPAGLIRPSGAGEPPTLGLSVMDTVVQSIVTGTRDLEIDLPIIGKWVRVPAFALPADPLVENPIGGMPAAERLQSLSGTTTGLFSTTLTTDMPPDTLMESVTGEDQTPGVPALLGRIKGTVNETIKELKEVLRTLDPIAVTAALRIRIVDDQNPSSTTNTSLVQVQFGGGPFGALTAVPAAGTALVDANAFTFSLRIPPLFSELRAAAPEVVTLSVYVSLDLSVTPPASAAPVKTTIDFPPIPLVLPTIPIPTIVVLCEHELFFGRKLVVVPSDSLIGQALSAGGRPVGDALTLTNQTLTALSSVISGLAGAVSFAGFLASAGGGAAGMTSTAIAATMPAATAAAVLISIAESPGQTIIVASSQLSTLDAPNLVFNPGGWFGLGRATANHMASSLIVIGRPGTTVSFGQQAGWPIQDQQLTPLTITLGPGVGCAISSLIPPGATVNIPPSSPASKMTIVFGGTVTSFSPRQNEDQISSVAIARPPAGLMLAT